MSRENVDLVRRGFDAFASGDIEELIDLLDPEVEWRPRIGSLLGVDVMRGREAVTRFLTEDLLDGFDEFRAEPLSFEDFGDKVLVPSRYTGRGEASGLEVNQTFFAVYSVRDGRITGQQDFDTREEALEALGREE